MNVAVGMTRAVALLAIVGISSGALVARAQDDGAAEDSPQLREAQARFQVAQAQFEQENFALAADTFREVYEMMAGHPRRYLVLFNIGRCLEATGAYRQAGEAYRQYLEEGGDQAANASEMTARAEEMERRSALTEGPPTNSAETTAETTVEADVASTPSGPDEGLLFGGVATLGVAVAGFAVMGIFGGMALAEDSNLAKGCGATASCQPEDVANADTFALVSDIGLGIGAAAAIAGTVLVILGLTSSSSGDTAGLRVTPMASMNGAGIQLGGEI